MSSSRFSRWKKSRIFQWVTTITTGGGFASGMSYSMDVMYSSIPKAENVKIALDVTNYTFSGIIAIFGTILAHFQIFKGITTPHHFEEKFKELATELAKLDAINELDDQQLRKARATLNNFANHSTLNSDINTQIRDIIRTDMKSAVEVDEKKDNAVLVNIPNRYEQILAILKSSTRSTPVQYLAAFGIAASVASTYDLILSIILKAAIEEGNLLTTLRIGTHISAGAFFIYTTINARREIYKAITTNNNLGPMFNDLRTKTETSLEVRRKNQTSWRNIAELVISLQEKFPKNITTTSVIHELRQKIPPKLEITASEEKELAPPKNSYCDRLTIWARNKSHSSRAQWIASIGNGTNFSAGVHYCFEQINAWIDPTSSSLRMANYITSGVIFMIETMITRSQVYHNVTTTLELNDQYEKLCESIKNSIGVQLQENSFMRDIFELLRIISAQDNTLDKTTRESLEVELCQLGGEYEMIDIRFHPQVQSCQPSLIRSEASSETVEMVTFYEDNDQNNGEDHKQPFLRRNSLSGTGGR